MDAAAATAFPLATEAALGLLRMGGNAMDAAVGAAWALSVCEPSGSGLGGQTVLLAHFAGGAVRAIDGHSSAPAAVSLATVTKQQQRSSHRSCTVPSTPATLDYAQRKYGRLSPAEVLAPAVRLAEQGYEITPLQRQQTGWVRQHLVQCPAASRMFLRDGAAPAVGEVFRQPELATTLRHMIDGVEDFYHGSMAGLIARDMRLRGGLITKGDLAALALPVEREPICIEYRGHRVVSVPPPGGGAQLLLALKLLEHLAPTGFESQEDHWRETMALAVSAAFRERELDPLPPGGTTREFAARFGEERVQRLAGELLSDRGRSDRCSGLEEPGDTTHVTVSDCEGNVVVLTQSIQSLFGAKVANPDLGFLYNNYLRTCPRYPHTYQLGSRCMPRSNASPTIVFRDGRNGGTPLLALGAAGSRRIVSAVLQVISSVIDRKQTVNEGVAGPRIHALMSGKVWIEQDAATEALLENLACRFSEISIKRRNDYKMGAVQALQFLPGGGMLAAADPRREGSAATIGLTRQETEEMASNGPYAN
jgi:gamma-glutamyltranspeptidase/glutathione hydrolase